MRAMDSPRPAWLARLARAGTGLADLLFPPRCLGCGTETGAAGALCTPCWEATDFIDAAACRRCGIPLEADFAGEPECAACIARPPVFARARSVVRYDTARELVLRFKHADRTDYAPAFAAWMARAGSELLAATDLIVPVPLHRGRLLARVKAVQLVLFLVLSLVLTPRLGPLGMALAIVASDLLVQFGWLGLTVMRQTLANPLRHSLFLALIVAVVMPAGWLLGTLIRSAVPGAGLAHFVAECALWLVVTGLAALPFLRAKMRARLEAIIPN